MIDYFLSLFYYAPLFFIHHVLSLKFSETLSLQSGVILKLDDSDDQNQSIVAQRWLEELHQSRVERSLIAQQATMFYQKRRAIEYSIKTTISATMTLALIYGGPPLWIMGGAAVMLKLATEILNCYTRKEYIEPPRPGFLQASQAPFETDAAAVVCRKWAQKEQNHLHDQREQANYFLQKKIGLALVMGYALFTIFSAAMTLPVMAAGVIFTLALMEQAHEEWIPFVESDSDLELDHSVNP